MKRNSGFTLLEALISLAIASTLIIPISGWLWSSQTQNGVSKKLYAVGLLEDQLTQQVMLKQVPSRNYYERDELGRSWEIQWSSRVSGDETCLTGVAILNQKQSLGSASVCYYE